MDKTIRSHYLILQYIQCARFQWAYIVIWVWQQTAPTFVQLPIEHPLHINVVVKIHSRFCWSYVYYGCMLSLLNCICERRYSLYFNACFSSWFRSLCAQLLTIYNVMSKTDFMVECTLKCNIEIWETNIFIVVMLLCSLNFRKISRILQSNHIN